MAIKNAKLTKAEQKRLYRVFDVITRNHSFIAQLESKYKDTSLSLALELLSEELSNASSHKEDLIDETLYLYCRK